MIHALLLSMVLTASPVQSSTPEIEIHLKPELAKVEEIWIATDDAGVMQYHLIYHDGREEWLTPQAFTQMIVDDQNARGWFLTFLNITSPFGLIWVGVGLLGQILFTGRMVVQLIASEKSKRSVVPTAFWWMSLIGATMLIIYFIWRWDVVGILGQATGWFIYIRNLFLIYTHKKSQQLGESPEDAEAAAE
ncbi:MAG: lipid-A-disaccharide synthase N-terminal domain-containing protein [Phycisphaeraceae bacterium JB051]